MKTLWTGTDALLYSSWPKLYKKWWYIIPFRIFARLTDFFCQEHYIVSEHLRKELKGLKKPIKVLIDPPYYPEKIEKIQHERFCVLYLYKAGEFWEWIYGYDIIRQLESEYLNICFWCVSGQDDMKEVYPYIDFYLRPNRHDGAPRMIMECEINEIPYYWSKENPDINEIRNKLDEAIRLHDNVQP